MKQSFLTNLVFVILINLVIKPLYLLGIEVEVQNRLGPDLYGLYFALLNSAFLLQIVNDFGLQVFNNRQVSVDRDQLTALFPAFISLKLILSVVYLIFLYFLGIVLGFKLEITLLLLIGLNMILTSFVLFFRSAISGLGYYRIDSALSVLDKFLMLFIIGGMLFFVEKDDFTVYHFVFGQTAALILTAIIAFLLITHYSTARLSIPFTREIGALLVKAAPYALAVFLMTLYTRIDGVMLVKLLPDGRPEAGIYAAGYRILDALNMVAYLFAVLLLPMFSRNQANPAQLRTLLDEGFRYMCVLVIPLVVIGVIYRNELIILLYDEADTYWASVFAVLVCTFLMMGMMYIFGTLLTALGQIKAMNRIFFVTLFGNIILNFILIPQSKAMGAAIATLATQMMAVLGIVYLSFRKVSIDLSVRYVLSIIAFTACIVSIGLLLQYFHWLSPLWSVLLFLAASGSAALLFGVVRLSEIRAIVQGS